MNNHLRSFVTRHNWSGFFGRLLMRMTGWGGRNYYLYAVRRDQRLVWKYKWTSLHGWKELDCEQF